MNNFFITYEWYIVGATVLVTWVAVLLYLSRLERRLKKLEQQLHDKEL